MCDQSVDMIASRGDNGMVLNGHHIRRYAKQVEGLGTSQVVQGHIITQGSRTTSGYLIRKLTSFHG